MKRPKYFAIIPAAGFGSRMSNDVPKQYLLLNGKTILSHTLSIFTTSDLFEKIVLVLSSDDVQKNMIKDYPKITIANGGERRIDSVRNGLRALENIASEDDWIVVHDAARPLLPQKDLENLIAALEHEPVGAILGTPVRDTLKKCNQGGAILHTVNREGLWCAQTPQAFRYHILKKALQEKKIAFTDEASAIEHLGLTVKIVPGSAVNIKITYAEDLLWAEYYLDRGTSCE